MNNDWRSRRQRSQDILDELDIGKTEFCEKLSVSDSQYYRWIKADVDSPHAVVPNVRIFSKFCTIFDISPTYILFGIGQKRMSKIPAESQMVDLISSNKKMLDDVVLPFINGANTHMREMETLLKRAKNEKVAVSSVPDA